MLEAPRDDVEYGRVRLPDLAFEEIQVSQRSAGFARELTARLGVDERMWVGLKCRFDERRQHCLE